jgi:hypothetical protein
VLLSRECRSACLQYAKRSTVLGPGLLATCITCMETLRIFVDVLLRSGDMPVLVPLQRSAEATSFLLASPLLKGLHQTGKKSAGMATIQKKSSSSDTGRHQDTSHAGFELVCDHRVHHIQMLHLPYSATARYSWHIGGIELTRLPDPPVGGEERRSPPVSVPSQSEGLPAISSDLEQIQQLRRGHLLAHLCHKPVQWAASFTTGLPRTARTGQAAHVLASATLQHVLQRLDALQHLVQALVSCKHTEILLVYQVLIAGAASWLSAWLLLSHIPLVCDSFPPQLVHAAFEKANAILDWYAPHVVSWIKECSSTRLGHAYGSRALAEAGPHAERSNRNNGKLQ